jgi:hypothetical protein
MSNLSQRAPVWLENMTPNPEQAKVAPSGEYELFISEQSESKLGSKKQSLV